MAVFMIAMSRATIGGGGLASRIAASRTPFQSSTASARAGGDRHASSSAASSISSARRRFGAATNSSAQAMRAPPFRRPEPVAGSQR
jgi:hypothetical protein